MGVFEVAEFISGIRMAKFKAVVKLSAFKGYLPIQPLFRPWLVRRRGEPPAEKATAADV